MRRSTGAKTRSSRTARAAVDPREIGAEQRVDDEERRRKYRELQPARRAHQSRSGKSSAQTRYPSAASARTSPMTSPALTELLARLPPAVAGLGDEMLAAAHEERGEREEGDQDEWERGRHACLRSTASKRPVGGALTDALRREGRS